MGLSDETDDATVDTTLCTPVTAAAGMDVTAKVKNCPITAAKAN